MPHASERIAGAPMLGFACPLLFLYERGLMEGNAAPFADRPRDEAL